MQLGYKVANFHIETFEEYNHIEKYNTSSEQMRDVYPAGIDKNLTSGSAPHFKKKVTAILFEILRVQDTYVDIQDIIDNISKQKEK